MRSSRPREKQGILPRSALGLPLLITGGSNRQLDRESFPAGMDIGMCSRLCYYCGEVADSIDHVVPQSMLRALRLLDDPEVFDILAQRNRVMEVDCCRDCNCRLGNIYSQNLYERRDQLRERLRAKHKMLLQMPDWTDAELGRMGPAMQTAILNRLAERDQVRRRLAYKGPATRLGLRIRV